MSALTVADRSLALLGMPEVLPDCERPPSSDLLTVVLRLPDMNRKLAGPAAAHFLARFGLIALKIQTARVGRARRVSHTPRRTANRVTLSGHLDIPTRREHLSRLERYEPA